MSATRFSRRGLLGAGAVGTGALMAGHAVPAAAESRESGFAVVTDTHADLDTPARTDDLRRVMAHIATRDPAFVLNCGDITDYGVADEFSLYRSCVPDALWPRVRHVPGNHEVSWNGDALEAYRRVFGPTRYSFDALGLHVVAMDPMVSQERDFRFGADLLGWLERDFRRVRTGRPIVVFNHFPLGGRWPYVTNDEDFLRLIEPFPVRAAFSGHRHRWAEDRLNGMTQIVANAIYIGPYYYWCAVKRDTAGVHLEIREVRVSGDGPADETLVATAPLTAPGPGGDLGPFTTTAAVSGATLTATVTAAGRPGVARVWAEPAPQGGPAAGWTELRGADGSWSGTIDVSGLAPGRHRLQVRTADGHGVVYDDTVPYEIPAPSGEEIPRVAWTAEVTGRVAADLAAHQDLVIAGTTEGEAAAFEISATSARRRWRTRLGGVFKALAFAAAGSLVIVGSADHGLYALDPHNGRTVWRRDLGAPVQCDVVVADVDGQGERILVTAGHTLFCLDDEGRIVWRAALGEIFTGAVVCDGRRVVSGSGSGAALGFDARTGEPLWSTPCTGKTTAYDKLIYGPWTSRLRLLPSGDVLLTTFTTALALDPASGDVVWSSAPWHQLEYTPPVISSYGALILDGKDGTFHLLDNDTGATLWSVKGLPANNGAGPVATSDPATYVMVGATGLMIRIDLDARTVTPLLQVTSAFSSSTPVRIGEVLVAGAQDGILRGITGWSR